MRWTNTKHQTVFFSKIESLPWRVFNLKLIPPTVIKIDKPLRIITNERSIHFLIYELNGEEYVKELGQIVKIEENGIELSVKFSRGYLSTTQKYLKNKMRETCKKMEKDIEKEDEIYKMLNGVYGGYDSDAKFFAAEKKKLADKYQLYIHNMKLL
jgi:hypothetical protein